MLVSQLKLTRFRKDPVTPLTTTTLIEIPIEFNPLCSITLQELLKEPRDMGQLFSFIGLSEDDLEDISIISINPFTVIFVDDFGITQAILSY